MGQGKGRKLMDLAEEPAPRGLWFVFVLLKLKKNGVELVCNL